MRRLLAVLLCAVLPACFGRNPAGELRLDAPSIEQADFEDALFQVVGVHLKPGNGVETVDNGRVFDAAVEAITGAQRSIHIVSFIWNDGKVSNRILDAIARRSRAGVQCRVIVDAIGSPDFGGLQHRLEAMGCEAHRFRPLPGQDDAAREHRKLVIVDGRIGITGGFGIDDRWDGDGARDDPPEWRDSNLLVRGPAVADMQQAFAENWLEATGALLPRDSFPDLAAGGTAKAAFVKSKENSVSTDGDKLVQLLIASAHTRIWISNAYFVPSTPIMDLLARKARQGLDVRILAAGERTDTRPYLAAQRERMDQLARGGVRTFEYLPTMMHGKAMLVDDRVVLVGSANLDALSLNEMDEGALVVQDPRLAREEARKFLDDLNRSIERVPEARRQAVSR